MDPSWLAKYPQAAAMLQRDDDVLEYAPQEAPLAPVPREVLEAVHSLEAAAAALCDWIEEHDRGDG